MRRRLLHLARIGVGQAQCVTRELDHGALHAQTDPQEGNVVLAGEAHGLDLTLDTAVAEARGHQDTGHLAQLRSHVLAGDLLRIDVAQFG